MKKKSHLKWENLACVERKGKTKWKINGARDVDSVNTGSSSRRCYNNGFVQHSIGHKNTYESKQWGVVREIRMSIHHLNYYLFSPSSQTQSESNSFSRRNENADNLELWKLLDILIIENFRSLDWMAVSYVVFKHTHTHTSHHIIIIIIIIQYNMRIFQVFLSSRAHLWGERKRIIIFLVISK